MRIHSTVCLPQPSEAGFADLTVDVQRAIADAGISSGRVSVFARDPGAAVFLNENETGLRADLDRAFARLSGGSVAGSASVVLPVLEGQPWIGDWQRVIAYVTEQHDREFLIQITGA